MFDRLGFTAVATDKVDMLSCPRPSKRPSLLLFPERVESLLEAGEIMDIDDKPSERFTEASRWHNPLLDVALLSQLLDLLVVLEFRFARSVSVKV